MAPGLLAALLLTACGGGGGCGNCDTDPGGAYPTPDPDITSLPPSSTYANRCTSPNQRDEKSFVLSYLNENYLWYPEMVPPPADLANTYAVDQYFYSLLSHNAPIAQIPTYADHPADSDYIDDGARYNIDDPSYRYVDIRFSYVLSTNIANSLDTGYSAGGYGFYWVIDRDGKKRITYVKPGSQADVVGRMTRGGEIISSGEYDNPNLYPYTATGMYPYAKDGIRTTTFTYRDVPNGPTRTITLNAAMFQEEPVPITKVIPWGGRNVGYLLFLNHSSIAQDKLITAITNLRGVNDLVLDLRYNDGGFIYAAQSLASMIAGPGMDGRTFERQAYNGKVADASLPFTTKVTWKPVDTAIPPGYYNNNNNIQYDIGAALPALNLKRVYVLTSDITASASEALINALRGVDVNVVLIGTKTRGQPYGANRRDNCNTAYYAIAYQGFNDKNASDYVNGFAPTCLVHDDFNRVTGDTTINNPLGNQREALLYSALEHIRTGQCTATASQN